MTFTLCSFSPDATQEHGVSDAWQGRSDWRSDREYKRGVLLGTGTPVAAQLHLQVQSDRWGGPETTVTARVPQRFSAGRRTKKVIKTSNTFIFIFIFL